MRAALIFLHIDMPAVVRFGSATCRFALTVNRYLKSGNTLRNIPARKTEYTWRRQRSNNPTRRRAHQEKRAVLWGTSRRWILDAVTTPMADIGVNSEPLNISEALSVSKMKIAGLLHLLYPAMTDEEQAAWWDEAQQVAAQYTLVHKRPDPWLLGIEIPEMIETYSPRCVLAGYKSIYKLLCRENPQEALSRQRRINRQKKAMAPMVIATRG